MPRAVGSLEQAAEETEPATPSERGQRGSDRPLLTREPTSQARPQADSVLGRAGTVSCPLSACSAF